MRLNADFSKPAHIHFAEDGWKASPLAGVERFMLDRIGDEKARATSLVRYAPGSHFSAHTHDLGEEFLVLEGTFSDASGDFGPGSYVRNPPGSEHAPWSEEGAVIFVKLRQFDPKDLTRVVVDTDAAAWTDYGDGVSALPLHTFGNEEVLLLRFAPGEPHLFAFDQEEEGGGMEVLVLEGVLYLGEERFGPWDWLRFPPGEENVLQATEEGARLFVKGGHLDPLPMVEEEL